MREAVGLRCTVFVRLRARGFRFDQPTVLLPTQISYERIVQVIPIRIGRVDKPNLPCARPVLDSFLALDSISDIIEIFRIDKFFQAITLRKSLDESLAVLKYPAR